MFFLLDISQQIDAIIKVSGTYITWSLSITGASILAIVSTSYLRPANTHFRKVYFLFVPGWVMLLFSMHYGDDISRSNAAAASTKNSDLLLKIGENINSYFDCQLTCFKVGLSCFMLWLIIYLFWWVLGTWEVTK